MGAHHGFDENLGSVAIRVSGLFKIDIQPAFDGFVQVGAEDSVLMMRWNGAVEDLVVVLLIQEDV